MDIELILLEDVESVGKIGEKIRVKAGFARNFLLPQNLATRATPGVLRQLEAKKTRLQKEREDLLAAARKLAEDIEKASITIPVQAGEDDRLFGSVGAHQVADALEEAKIVVDRRKIVLAEPIKQLGVHTVPIQLHPEVTAALKVWVVKA